MATRRRGVSLFLQGLLHRGLELLDAVGALDWGGLDAPAHPRPRVISSAAAA
jgi:hypothetical protein